MALNIFISTSLREILTSYSQFKNVRILNKRFMTSTLEKAHNSTELREFRCKDFKKLMQMDEKYHLTKPGLKVLDLGAAPGSWSQYLARKVNPDGNGLVVAVDIKNFENIKGVQTLPEMNFLSESFQNKMQEILGRGQKFDCIFSDIKPDVTSVKNVDKEKMRKIIFGTYIFLVKYLKKGGSCVIKIQSVENDRDVKSEAKRLFATVHFPSTAITQRSAPEIYLVGQNFLSKEENL